MNPHLTEGDILRLRKGVDDLIACKARCNYASRNMKAFVEYDRDALELSVTIPGTGDWADVMADFKLFGGPEEQGVGVHSGIRHCVDLIEPELYHALRQLNVDSRARIHLKGHSLGAGVAQLLVVRSPWFRDSLTTVDLFACPRVFRAGGDGLFARVRARVLRVSLSGDTITRMPPPLIPPTNGFSHVGVEYVIPKGSDLREDHSLEAYKRHLAVLKPS